VIAQRGVLVRHARYTSTPDARSGAILSPVGHADLSATEVPLCASFLSLVGHADTTRQLRAENGHSSPDSPLPSMRTPPDVTDYQAQST
jgi:hypothetical protein